MAGQHAPSSSLFFHKKRMQDNIQGYLFLMPALIGFVLFVGGPILISMVLSFFNYNLITPPEFIGIANIKRFISHTEIHQSFWHTIKFLFILTPVHCVGGLLLAYAVFSVKHCRSLYRSIVYFPTIVTTASVAVAWGYMFATDTGIINYYIRQMGFDAIPWLTNATMAYGTITIFSFWKFIGTAFLYYYIGLQNVPASYYDAAKIDGANSFQIFTRVTLPLLTPTIFFVVITKMISIFQIFDEPFLLTGGGPGIATRTVSLDIYSIAFQQMNTGYGATVALVLFLIIMAITFIQFIGQKKWVVYDFE